MLLGRVSCAVVFRGCQQLTRRSTLLVRQCVCTRRAEERTIPEPTSQDGTAVHTPKLAITTRRRHVSSMPRTCCEPKRCFMTNYFILAFRSINSVLTPNTWNTFHTCLDESIGVQQALWTACESTARGMNGLSNQSGNAADGALFAPAADLPNRCATPRRTRLTGSHDEDSPNWDGQHKTHPRSTSKR